MLVVESYANELNAQYKGNNRKSLKSKASNYVKYLKKSFLPQGYPNSVSKDYLEYQIWDTIQALASSIVGTLAGQSVLIGIGVGNAEATILSASITWLLKDGLGMVGQVLFANWSGTHLDSQCKQWRLLADILNDVALFFDLMSGQFPIIFTPAVCLSSIIKSLVGLIGGSTRAAITQHQALQNNMADVSTKDAIQERISNLMAILFNFLFVWMVTGNWLIIWTTFFLLVPIHLFANWRAVKCVQFKTLNRARFGIIIQHWLTSFCNDKSSQLTPVLSIAQVNSLESIKCLPFLNKALRTIYFGCSFKHLTHYSHPSLPNLLDIYKDEHYLLYLPQWDQICNNQNIHCQFYVILHTGAQPIDQMKALLQVELITFLRDNPSYFKKFELDRMLMSNDEIVFTSQILSCTNRLMPILIDSFHKSNADWFLDFVHFDADEWRIDLKNVEE